MMSSKEAEVRRCLSAFLYCLVMAGGLAEAEEVTLDLAGDRRVTRSVAPQDLRFTIVNRLPKTTYTVSVVTKVIPIGPFPEIALPAGLVRSPACDDLTQAATALDTATDEKQVPTAVAVVRERIAAGACTDPPTIHRANAAVASTVSTIEGTYPVAYGTSVTVLVIRGTEAWEFVFDGGSRGDWLVTYGVAITPGDDQGYFSQAAGEGKFAVTAEAETDQLRLIPSVYYTWLGRRFATRLFSPGLTAGVGLKDDAPAVFAGASLLHNWNLQFAVGVTIAKHERLRGQYAPGQELSENLTPDQLNEGVFRPSLGFVVSFRFGGNPWGGSEGDDSAEGQETPEAKSRPPGLGQNLQAPLTAAPR
jgi:hypothetical protein